MSLLQSFQVHFSQFFQQYWRVYPIGQVFKGTGIALSMLLFPTAGIQTPAMGAERIRASYSILERSISVDALETYAKTGELEGNLAYYARYLKPQQLERLRRVLLTPIELGPVEVSQFLYTPIGETLLHRLGNVVKTEAGQPGFYALRSALILAAAEPKGLTLLNILRKFPTRGIRIDLERSLDIASELENWLNRQIKRSHSYLSNQPQQLLPHQALISLNCQIYGSEDGLHGTNRH
ncbi:MAG: alpha/beta hydrolase [Cyanobacteriota bacterium]